MVLKVNLLIIAVAAISMFNDVEAFNLERSPVYRGIFYGHRMDPDDDLPVVLVPSNKFINENSKQRPDADMEPFGAEPKVHDEYSTRRKVNKLNFRRNYATERVPTHSPVTDGFIYPLPEDSTKYAAEEMNFNRKTRYNPEPSPNRWYTRVPSNTEWV